MAVLTCKICGGSLEIVENTSVAVCEHCGRTQTLPKLDDETRMRRYDRANHHRRNNDYDKAMNIYESILDEDTTDSEAYWSLLLCRYGIVYVEDQKTGKHIPTMNRVQHTSILADADYKATLQYADSYQKQIYENDAKEIYQLQKRFLEISQKEEPFDVFISYKDKDDLTGQPTQDRAIAMEIYNRLHRENLKVFFSHFTLDNKLGEEFEPYIFSALNSAKVMVVLGTKKEYFEATWVKNEWSRFHALIQAGEKKTLIAAYKNMDAYDLPPELDMQAQDMEKMGFLENLVYVVQRDIERYSEKKRPIPQPVLPQSDVLEDVQYDVILNVNGFRNGKLPCVNAVKDYFGWELIEAKHLVESHNPKLASNVSIEEAQDIRDFFQKRGFSVNLVPLAKRTVSPVINPIQTIENNVGDVSALIDRGNMCIEDQEWSKAEQFFEKALNIDAKCAEAYLGKLLIEARISDIDKLGNCSTSMVLSHNKNYQRAYSFGNADLKQKLETVSQANKQRIYNLGVSHMNSAITVKEYFNAGASYREAIRAFECILEYKDASQLTKRCQDLLKTLELENTYKHNTQLMEMAVTEQDYLNAASAFRSIKDYRDSKLLADLCKERADNIAENAKIAAENKRKEQEYQNGLNALRRKDYATASNYFTALGDYKDSAQKVQQIVASNESRKKLEVDLEKNEKELAILKNELEERKKEHRVYADRLDRTKLIMSIIYTVIGIAAVWFIVYSFMEPDRELRDFYFALLRPIAVLFVILSAFVLKVIKEISFLQALGLSLLLNIIMWIYILEVSFVLIIGVPYNKLCEKQTHSEYLACLEKYRSVEEKIKFYKSEINKIDHQLTEFS